jgi:hypothetical protein
MTKTTDKSTQTDNQQQQQQEPKLEWYHIIKRPLFPYGETIDKMLPSNVVRIAHQLKYQRKVFLHQADLLNQQLEKTSLNNSSTNTDQE